MIVPLLRAHGHTYKEHTTKEHTAPRDERIALCQSTRRVSGLAGLAPAKPRACTSKEMRKARAVQKRRASQPRARELGRRVYLDHNRMKAVPAQLASTVSRRNCVRRRSGSMRCAPPGAAEAAVGEANARL